AGSIRRNCVQDEMPAISSEQEQGVLVLLYQTVEFGSAAAGIMQSAHRLTQIQACCDAHLILASHQLNGALTRVLCLTRQLEQLLVHHPCKVGTCNLGYQADLGAATGLLRGEEALQC